MGLCCTLGIARFDSMPKKIAWRRLTNFVLFGQCRQKIRIMRKGTVKTKKTQTNFLGLLCSNAVGCHSWLSRNKQIILDSHYSETFLLFNKSFFNHAFSVKMAGDWPRSFFWRFHGSRLRLALLTSRLVNNAYMIILRCLCNIVKENERTTNKAKSIFVLEIFKYFSF